MEYHISVGASREVLRKLAKDLADACEGEGMVDFTVYARHNGNLDHEVQIQFSNDDMEDRTDLQPDVILVDVDA